MEKVVSDTGVIRVVARPLRDDLDEVPLGLLWWQRRYQTEPWRAADGIAAIRKDEEIKGDPRSYWYAKVVSAIQRGSAWGTFVNGGSVSGICLVDVDLADPTRAVLIHLSHDAFGGDASRQALLDFAREWCRAQGRKLMQKIVTVEWKEPT